MLTFLSRIWKLPDLRRRVLFVVGVLLLTRVLAQIPIPGVDIAQLQQFFGKNQIFGLLNVFSGGAMENFSLIMMGVGPYITASIIMQLLVMIIPRLEEVSKEGQSGYRQINQWTRYLTVPLALIQSYGLIILLRSQNMLGGLTAQQTILTLIMATAGSIFLMWLGELISEQGIGNGISLIIMLGILSGLPQQVRNTISTLDPTQVVNLIIFGLLALAVLALIVVFNQAERRIPVYYARRARFAATSQVVHHLPLKVNTAGVIPIIFALAVLTFPAVIGRFFSVAKSVWLRNSASAVADFFQNNTYYAISYCILVFLFTYFYTQVVFKPTEIAENLQKQGSFIPGVRPGSETAGFLNFTITRITLAGALFLALVAVLPFIAQAVTGIQTLVLGGTGILIVVSVVIETMRQIKAAVQVRTYG